MQCRFPLWCVALIGIWPQPHFIPLAAISPLKDPVPPSILPLLSFFPLIFQPVPRSPPSLFHLTLPPPSDSQRSFPFLVGQRKPLGHCSPHSTCCFGAESGHGCSCSHVSARVWTVNTVNGRWKWLWGPGQERGIDDNIHTKTVKGLKCR